MVSTRSKRKQANEKYIKLPETTKKAKKQKNPKKNKKQNKKNKQKKQQNNVELTVEENEPDADILDVNEVAKLYNISNEPKKHTKKSKAKNRKDHKKFYGLHFFEVLRKSTIRRYKQGYRIRYSTLSKYQLVDEYRAWKEAQVDNGFTAFQQHLDMLNKEITYQERFDQNIQEYVNPTAKYVSRVLSAQNIGSGIQPDNIRIEINRENTPQVENEQLEFNENYSQENNQVVITEPQKQEIQYSEADLQPQPNNRRLDAFYKKYPKTTYTFGDAIEWLSGKGRFYKGRQVKMKTAKDNINKIIQMIDILACDPLDNREFQAIPDPDGKIYKAKKPGRLVIKKDERGRPLKDMRANPAMPPRDIDLLHCFQGSRSSIRQKVYLIGLRPRKDGGKRRHLDKNIFSGIKVLLRQQNNSVVNHSPLRYLIGETQARQWDAEFDLVMSAYRKLDKKEKETGVSLSIPWQKVLEGYERIKKTWENTLKQKMGNIPADNDALRLKQFNAHMDYLLFSLYVYRPSVRDDYGICRLLSPSEKISDYIKRKYDPVVDEETGVPTKEGAMEREMENGQYFNYYSLKEKTFVFQRYKTEALYNQRRFDLKNLKAPFGNGKKLASIIADSYKRYPRKWLIARASNGVDVREGKFSKSRGRAKKSTTSVEETGIEPEPKGVFSSMLNRTKSIHKLKNPSSISKIVGVNMFRHAWVSKLWREDKINMIQKAQLAEMMLHSVKQAENYNFQIDKSV